MAKLISKLIYSRVISVSSLGRDTFPHVFLRCFCVIKTLTCDSSVGRAEDCSSLGRWSKPSSQDINIGVLFGGQENVYVARSLIQNNESLKAYSLEPSLNSSEPGS